MVKRILSNHKSTDYPFNEDPLYTNLIGGFMLKTGFVTLMISLSLCISAFCEEETAGPKGFSYGFGMGQQTSDVSISLNITSPYFHFNKKPNPRSWCAIRVSGDYRIKSATPIGGTADSVMSYFDARIGFVKAEEVSKLIRMYEEFGCISIFPTTKLASSTVPRFGLYGYLGGEVFVGKNLMTKSTSIFMEIGVESTFTEHRFDKITNRPLIGMGPTMRAGGRFYI
jgi:hypothetical protein